MHLLQIDTISVVARSPYLVLFSRLGPYRPQWLEQTLAEGEIFETWAHEACFAPIEDYGLLRAARPLYQTHWMQRSAERIWREQKSEMQALLSQIKQRGPVLARDFVAADGAPKQSGGWWNWKHEKRWLEAWLALGALMVTRREGFQRVYDLSERVLAKKSCCYAEPSLREAQHQILLRSMHALGVFKLSHVADYYRIKLSGKESLQDALLDCGAQPVLLAGENDWYLTARALSALSEQEAVSARALSPFDPLIWDRRRARELFDFDYRLEAYTPAAKRQYGYYVLPLLAEQGLFARVDAKAHRADGRFEVMRVHFEGSSKLGLKRKAVRALRALANWHQTPELVGKAMLQLQPAGTGA
jgi:hypothetical protein